MKELSIEEKAKRYDSLLVRLQEAKVDNNVCDERYCCVIDDIIPELKDSEDERMIQYFKDLAPFDKAEELYEKYGFSHKDAIAWLEKQCEQKPVELFDIPENGIENDVSVTSRMEYVPEHLKSIAKFILEYAHWNLHKDEWNHPVSEVPLFRVLDALVQEGKPYQGACCCVEQKPAWSEEDEKTIVKMRDFFIKVLGDKPDFTEDKRYEEFIEFIDNRLKSLRPHSSYHEGFKKGFAKAKEMHYDHWKPSERQLDVLKSAISELDAYDDSLTELYNDLKKLKD